jgi:signal recognition particle receptor subunit beta
MALDPVHELLAGLGIPITNGELVVYFYYLVAAIILIVLFKTCFGRSGGKKAQKGTALLVWGPCGAGKTTLFYRLREETFPKTITSMVPNEAKITLNNKAYTLIDYPGHQRLRAELMTTHLRKAGKVIFVLDASNLKAELPRVAQQLYDLLTRSYISDAAVPVIVACNKSDDPASLSSDKSRALLEGELNKIRSTRSANPGLTGTDGDDSESGSIGVVGKPFKFEDLEHDIDFVSCSCFKGDLEGLKSVITSI